jgi:hypothetical protein
MVVLTGFFDNIIFLFMVIDVGAIAGFSSTSDLISTLSLRLMALSLSETFSNTPAVGFNSVIFSGLT